MSYAQPARALQRFKEERSRRDAGHIEIKKKKNCFDDSALRTRSHLEYIHLNEPYNDFNLLIIDLLESSFRTNDGIDA